MAVDHVRWLVSAVPSTVVSRHDAEIMMDTWEDGRFLIRHHPSKLHAYILSVVYKTKPTHHELVYSSGKYKYKP